MGEPPTSFGYYIFAVALLVITEHVTEFYPNIKLVRNDNVVIRYTGYVLILTIMLMVGVFFNGGQFIYFSSKLIIMNKGYGKFFLKIIHPAGGNVCG